MSSERDSAVKPELAVSFPSGVEGPISELACSESQLDMRSGPICFACEVVRYFALACCFLKLRCNGGAACRGNRNSAFWDV